MNRQERTSNAEEEPEHSDYPKGPEFRKQFGPRGILRTSSDGTIEDSGPLTRKWMETVDDEFMERAPQAGKPVMIWSNPSRMHLWTYLTPESQENLAKYGIYGAGMIEHDQHVGVLLDKLDELGIADDTIVVYTTGNGPHYNGWPDGGTSPFQGEKNTDWEGDFRVPGMVRWPAKIKSGQVLNEIMDHLDRVPTIIAAPGEADINDRLLNGREAMGKSFEVHLDAEHFLPCLSGDAAKGPRDDYFH